MRSGVRVSGREMIEYRRRGCQGESTEGDGAVGSKQLPLQHHSHHPITVNLRIDLAAGARVRAVYPVRSAHGALKMGITENLGWMRTEQ